MGYLLVRLQPVDKRLVRLIAILKNTQKVRDLWVVEQSCKFQNGILRGGLGTDSQLDEGADWPMGSWSGKVEVEETLDLVFENLTIDLSIILYN